MSNDDLTLSASHAAELDLMRQELAEKQRTIVELKAKLCGYESADTVPPDPDEPATGDYSEDAQEARLSMLETRTATRESELVEVYRQLDEIKTIVTDTAMIVANLPCADCPKPPALHSVTPPSRKTV
jgi:hypothetical protein